MKTETSFSEEKEAKRLLVLVLRLDTCTSNAWPLVENSFHQTDGK
jgi:hypothetical protein